VERREFRARVAGSADRRRRQRVGQVAAELALGANTEGPRQARHVVLPVELITRGSGEISPR